MTFKNSKLDEKEQKKLLNMLEQHHRAFSLHDEMCSSTRFEVDHIPVLNDFSTYLSKCYIQNVDEIKLAKKVLV